MKTTIRKHTVDILNTHRTYGDSAFLISVRQNMYAGASEYPLTKVIGTFADAFIHLTAHAKTYIESFVEIPKEQLQQYPVVYIISKYVDGSPVEELYFVSK